MQAREILQRSAKQVTLALTAAVVTAAVGWANPLRAEVRLQGAGATFPAPLYSRWVAEFQQSHPAVAIDYQSIGSGGGIKDFTDQTVDFAATDAPMMKAEIAKAGGAEDIIEFPSCAGAVVPAFNLQGVSSLNFSGDVLAKIYMGKITMWNDPALMELNPGAQLPATAITPVHRTDGSGTTSVWTNYLASVSDDFKNSIGVGKQVQFPGGQGGKGNEGVTAVVQQTPGAIGYIEENYADQNHIAYGAVKNAAGQFVKASPQSVAAAGAGAAEHLKGTLLRANIWNQQGDQAYPISSFTYLLVYKDLKNVKTQEQAQALADFLRWAIHDGQKLASDLDYAPLTDPVRAKVEQALDGLTYKGAALKAHE